MRNATVLRAKFSAGEALLGPWCVIPSDAMANAIASSGVDFILVDREHGAIGPERSEGMIRAAQSEGCGAIVRLGGIDEGAILHSLDSGADGVLVAHVESAADAAKVVALSRYAPVGARGFSPYTRAGGYGMAGLSTHAARSNEATLVGVIIEGRRGIDNLDEIASTPGLDLVYIGAYDLSAALGVPGQVAHSEVRAHLERSVAAIRRHGKTAGGYVAKDAEDLRWMLGLGMGFITWLPDVTLLHEGFKAAAAAFADVKRGCSRA